MRLFIGFATIIAIVAPSWSELDESLHKYNVERESSISAKRSIQSLRGMKHFDPEEDGFFDNFGFEKGQYFGQKENKDFSDIRSNIPGEPDIDYPAYFYIPKTAFSCAGRSRGYYADEETGCQVFHVCDNGHVSSFLCPVGSLFSQTLLTCDWWSKVSCYPSQTLYDHENDSIQISHEKNFAKSENDRETLNYLKHEKYEMKRKSDVKRKSHRKAHTQDASNSPERFYDVQIDNIDTIDTAKRSKKYENSPIVRIKTLPSENSFRNGGRSSLVSSSEHHPDVSQSNLYYLSTKKNSVADGKSSTTVNPYDSTSTEGNDIMITPTVEAEKGITTPQTTSQETNTIKTDSFVFEPEFDDMERGDSIGFINSQSERYLEMTDNQFVKESNYTTEAIQHQSRTKFQSEQGSTFVTADIVDTTTPIIENIAKSEELERKDKISDRMEPNYEVATISDIESPIPITVQYQEVGFAGAHDNLKSSDEFSRTHENRSDEVNSNKQYTTQNIHKISGFKTNISNKTNAKPTDSILNIDGNSNSDVTNKKIGGSVQNGKRRSFGQQGLETNHRKPIITISLKNHNQLPRKSITTPTETNGSHMNQQNRFESDTQNHLTEQKNSFTEKYTRTSQSPMLFNTNYRINDNHAVEGDIYQTTESSTKYQSTSVNPQESNFLAPGHDRFMNEMTENRQNEKDLSNFRDSKSRNLMLTTMRNHQTGRYVTQKFVPHNLERQEILQNNPDVNTYQRQNVRLDPEKFRVNYHTHYYPEAFVRNQNNQGSTENVNSRIHKNDHQPIITQMYQSLGNTIKMSSKFLERQRNEDAEDYYDYQNFDDQEANDNQQSFENFGVRFSKKNNDVPKIDKNPKILKNAYNINSGLQEAPVNFLWTMSRAISETDELTRPFNLKSDDNNQAQYSVESKNDFNYHETNHSSVRYNNPEHSNTNVGEMMDNIKKTTDTEVIPSLSFDLNNDNDRKKYYENVQKDALPQQEYHNVPSSNIDEDTY